MIERALVLFVWQSIDLVSWGIVEVEKCLTIFFSGLKTPRKTVRFLLTKTCNFVEEFF
jgi:hypothetical protein